MTAAIQLRKKKPTPVEKKQKREVKRLGTGMMLPGLVAEQKHMLAARDTSAIATPRSEPRGTYTGEPLTPTRPGATDAFKVLSLADGQRTEYKPPVAYCVGHSKIFTAGGGAK